jgi:cobalt/nickel transport system ATP-binding protein
VTQPSLLIEELAYAYPDGHQALFGVDLRVERGERVAVLGPNGAGKTTLVLHLNGLLTGGTGSVQVAGLPVVRENFPAIRRQVGIVFQDPDDQLFMPTVHDDVAFGPRNLGLPEADVERQVRAALERVGMWELHEKAPYRLSGGEKKRVAIAGVLAMAPDVLVMDEPTSGLDPRARRQMLRLIGEFEHTRILTSHDLEMVVELCSRTIVLDRGRVQADGATRDVFADDALLERCGLERPASLRPCAACGHVRP